jgi:hypothetical protein
MRPARRTVPPVMPAVLAVLGLSLSACDIPATGVVEAGGPASGVPAILPIYLVQDDSLVAVPRTLPDAGDPVWAVEALLRGPTPQERRKSLTTDLPRLPDMPTPAPTPTGLAVEGMAQGEMTRVTSQGGTVTVELLWYGAKLSALAADQLICTAAHAYLLTRRDLDSATVRVTGAMGGPVEGGGEGCPEL